MHSTTVLVTLMTFILATFITQVSALPETSKVARLQEHARLAKQGLCSTNTGQILSVERITGLNTTLSAPISKRGATWRPTDRPADECGGSSFENQSSGGSPFVDHCQCLMNFHAGRNGYYYIVISDVEYDSPWGCGSCAFGFGTPSNKGAKIGNTDMSDLIRISIENYASNGRVGAKGIMPCGGNRMNWAVFNTGK